MMYEIFFRTVLFWFILLLIITQFKLRRVTTRLRFRISEIKNISNGVLKCQHYQNNQYIDKNTIDVRDTKTSLTIISQYHTNDRVTEKFITYKRRTSQFTRAPKNITDHLPILISTTFAKSYFTQLSTSAPKPTLACTLYKAGSQGESAN